MLAADSVNSFAFFNSQGASAMATYLVTGGAGFIGSHIAGRLVREGEDVRVLDNFSTGRRTNLRDFESGLTLMEGDVRNTEAVARAVEGADYVIHQAALASVPRSINDPVSTNDVNVTGTVNLLRAAVDAGVRAFVYASSSSAYGDSEVLPKIETMTPAPKSPYAVSKLAGEYYCRAFSDSYGLSTASLRYFNVFGPRQDPTSQYAAVIPIFTGALLRGEAPTIFGDGEQSRDFTYIDNVVSANLLACRGGLSGGHVYNVACGDRFTLNELYARLQNVVGASVEPVYGAPRAGDVRHSQAAIGEIERDLGYKVEVTFEDGLERTVRWYRDVEFSG
jgi:nucleoside-diphosphate-sugar epimerase